MDLDVRAAARLLRVPERRLFEWAKAGAIPVHRMGEEIRFNRVDLLDWAAERRLRVAPELFDAEGRSRGAGFRLARALEAGGIHRDVEAADARSALQAVASLLPLPEGVDREMVASLFAARAGITPVGEGVAIPHARAPAVLPVAEPLLALAFLARPIDAGAKDGVPVGMLFALFSPSVRLHLHAISRIATALADRELRSLVERRANDAEILARLAAIDAAAAAPRGPVPNGEGRS